MALPISSSYRIFWTGKYLERAEVLARILDEKLLHTLELADDHPHQMIAWEEVLKAFGVYSDYARRYGQVTAREVVRFFVLDDQCPSSIAHSIHMARENASGSMPDDIFVALNKLYLSLKEPGAAAALAKDPHTFLNEVTETCTLVVGTVNRLWG